MAWGPPRADIKSGIVMNGPTPIMFDMFRAVACTSPNRLSRGASSFLTFGDSDAMPIIEASFEAHIIAEHDENFLEKFCLTFRSAKRTFRANHRVAQRNTVSRQTPEEAQGISNQDTTQTNSCLKPQVRK
jgi:hypothetical protein